VFNFHFLSAYTVGFVPVHFGTAYFSALEANLGHAFEFPPTTGTILLAESHDVMDPSPNSNGFDIFNLVNNFKIHVELYRFNYLKSRAPNQQTPQLAQFAFY